MNLPNELWYNIFSFLTQKSQSRFSSLWNLYNLDTEEIELLWSSNNLWFETASKGYTKLIRFLIKSGYVNNINKQYGDGFTALHLIISNDHKKCLELFIKSGADLNIQTDYGQTALHWASIHGHKEITKLLIKTGGVDLNIQNNFNETALHYASMNGHKEIVELLIKADGVDVNKQNNFNKTALYIASECGYKECVKLLIKAGAI